MADVQPFSAWRYDPTRVKLEDVLTEPYDKISPAQQAAYYQRSPYNLIRIELGRTEPDDDDKKNKYTRAADCLKHLRREKILIPRQTLGFFLYQQTFQWPASQLRTRRALIARVRLSPFADGVVLPHEQTLSKPKQDRMMLLQATQVYTGQIFLLYDGQKVQLPSLVGEKSLFQYTDEHRIGHQLEAIESPDVLKNIQDAFSHSTLYIADGHHRYETALAYRDQRRKTSKTLNPNAPAEFVMAALVDWRDPGLTILPTHRLIKNITNLNPEAFRKQLQHLFEIEKIDALNPMLQKLGKAPNQSHWFGMAMPSNQFWLLKAKTSAAFNHHFTATPALWERLDVAILHTVILDALLGIDEKRLREEANVTYHRDAAEMTQKLQRGDGQIGFFLNPTPIDQVIAIAEAHSRMPQKSTDFYPKFPSGLTLYDASSD